MGKLNNDAVSYITAEALDNPSLVSVLLEQANTLYASYVNSKDGHYMIFGAYRHLVFVPNFISGYMRRKPAVIEGLSDEQVEKEHQGLGNQTRAITIR